MIRIRCEACDRKYRIKDSYAGKTVPCPECGAEMRVPLPDLTEPTPALPSSNTPALPMEPVRSTFISRKDVP